MKKLLLLLIILGLGYLTVGWFLPSELGIAKYIDKTPPQIGLKTLHNRGLFLEIKAEDSLNLLTSLSLTSIQNEERKVFPLENYIKASTKKIEIRIPIKKIAESLNNGPASMRFSAEDSSYWKNKNQTTVELTIDKRSPKLEILSQQHKMYAGGSELIVYSTSDAHLKNSKVVLGEHTFYGTKLLDLLPNYDGDPNAHAVMIAAPLSMKNSEFTPSLVSSDQFGNESKIRIRMRFVEKKVPKGAPRLSLRFLESKIPNLVEEHLSDYPNHNKKRVDTSRDDISEQEWIEVFKTINEDYRSQLRQDIKKLLLKPTNKSFEFSHFRRPIQGSLMSGFGEQRYYKYNSKEAGYSLHEGFDLASVRHDTIYPTAGGIVLLAEEFGIYGNAVLIDHGLGVSSLYGHLSSLSVSKGETITRETPIGKSGETGLAGGDHLHFEIRVGFVAVTPIEWWDSKWFNDNILGKLRSDTAKD